MLLRYPPRARAAAFLRLAALFLVLAPCLAGPAQSQEATPHIVVVLADDLGWGDMGANNPEAGTETPALDRVAREGLRMIDAHSPSAVCIPTRYGLLTGRYPFRMKRGEGPLIRPAERTLPEVFASAGYHTAMVGKWHLGLRNEKDPPEVLPLAGGPVDRGFATFFGIPASLDIPPYYYIRDTLPVERPTEPIEANASEGWSSIQGAFWREGKKAPSFRHEEVLETLTAEAETVIADHFGEDVAAGQNAPPLFLYVALTGPHTPWLPTPPFSESEQHLYAQFVAQVDASIGRIARALENAGVSDQTVLVVTSDNGPVWYPEDVKRLGHSATGPFRGMKGDAWEGGHRVPFAVRWPGQIPAGAVSDQTFSLIDLFATLVGLIGHELPTQTAVDSLDFSAHWRDPAVELDEPIRPTMLIESSRRVTSLRAGPWKLIPQLGSGGFTQPAAIAPSEDGPTGQLYDLQADPGETNNLWLQHPDVVQRLSETLRELKTE